MCVLNIYIYIYISGVLHFPLWMIFVDLLMITCSILLFLNLKRRKDIRFDCCSLINECLLSPWVHFYSPTVATLSSVSFFSFFKTHLLCRGRGSVQCVSPGLYVSLKVLCVFCSLELCFVVFCHCCHFILFCLFIIMSIKKTCWGGDRWSLHFFCFQNTCMRNKWPKKRPSGLRVFHCP